MSILKSNITAVRIAALAIRDEKLFHIKDLANIWGIFDSHLLRITINRYVKNGLLYQIYRGFYSLLPPERLDPLLLGSKAIHGLCYLSTESVLFQTGYISQKISTYTFVGKKNKKISFGNNTFLCRQLHPRFLYNPEGIVQKNGILVAGIERVISDMLYFNPKYHFDHIVDWRKIKSVQEKIGYPLTPNRYDFT